MLFQKNLLELASGVFGHIRAAGDDFAAVNDADVAREKVGHCAFALRRDGRQEFAAQAVESEEFGRPAASSGAFGDGGFEFGRQGDGCHAVIMKGGAGFHGGAAPAVALTILQLLYILPDFLFELCKKWLVSGVCVKAFGECDFA